MKINWKIRLKNRAFWLGLIPAGVLAVQAVLELFGVGFDAGSVQAGIVQVVNAVFSLLAVLGVVTDPTTQGFSDSDRALGYDEPR